MKHALVKILGWKATVLHGDPSVFDRWKWLKRHLKAGPVRTLDAGCGSGCFALYAARIGNQVVGLDFGDANISTAERRASLLGLDIDFRQGDLRELGEISDKLGTFDQIICFEAIEHIKNDKKVIEDLSRLLKPGGRLLLTTPYKHYKPLLGDHISEEENGDHVRWGYTHEEIWQLCNASGLKVIAQEYISGVVSQQLINAMRVVGKANTTVAWGLVFPFRILQAIDSPLTKIAQYPYLSLGVVAEKTTSARARPRVDS